MPPAEFDQTTVTIAAPTKEGDAVFRATGRKLVFDGFMKVAGVSSEDQLLPELAEQQPVFPIEIEPDPALHPAAAALHRGDAGEGAGAAGHRPAAAPTRASSRRSRTASTSSRSTAASTRRMLGMRRDRQADPGVPRDHGRRLHRRHGAEARRGRGEHLDWIKLLKDFYGPFHAVVDGALGKIEHAGGSRQPVQVRQVRQADGLPHQQERLLPRLHRTASAARTQPGRPAGQADGPRGERAQVPRSAAAR